MMMISRLLTSASALALLTASASAQSLPSPQVKQITVGGQTITGVGTGTGTVAAGNDNRITGALQLSNALSELAAAGSQAAARANLGLGTAATQNVGPGGVASYGDACSISGGTDCSGARVTATGGTVARTNAARAADLINLADFAPSGTKVGQGNTVADSAALTGALAKAAANPGSTVYIPFGSYSFTPPSTGFPIPTQTTIAGAGQSKTVINWNDTLGYNLLTSPSSGRTADVMLRDFAVVGTQVANGNAATGGYPIIPSNVDGLTIQNVTVDHSRIMSIVARGSTDVRAFNNVVRYSGRDGINFAGCANVDVENNLVEHTDDDAIAIHSNTSDPWGVRANITVVGNRIFDGQGIKILSARQATISGNMLDAVRSQGIVVSTAAPIGSGFQEGASAALAISITGNTITNTISRANIDNLNQGNPGIVINGQAARAGSLNAIPGEANTSAGAVIDPYPSVFANSSSTSTPTPGSYGIVISGNLIARTLPASNTTAFPNWASFGFGQIFTRNGWVSPSLGESDLRDAGIFISGGVVRDVLITGNVIRGMDSGLGLGQAQRLDNIVFRGNEVVDAYTYGVLVNTTGALRAFIDDNLFDLDPFLKHPDRGSNGTWTAVGAPTAIFMQAGSGVYARRNTFRNLDQIWNGTAQPSGLFMDGSNITEADASVFGAFSTANKGVGTVYPSLMLYSKTVNDPTSSTFGAMTTLPATPLSIYQPPVDQAGSLGIGTGTLANQAQGATNNLAIGQSALTSDTSGQVNTAVGGTALRSNTTGSGHVAVGFATLYKATTGGYSVAIGPQALTNQTTPYFNIGIGANACSNITTGGSNICIGQSGNLTTGASNILIGQSLTKTTGTASNQIDIGDTITGTLATSGNNGSLMIAGSVAVGGHNLAAGATPTLSSCGTSPTISGSDNAGLITTGSGATACTLTFATAYNARPYCTVVGESAAVTYSVTKTAITIAAGAGINIDYQCNGQSGG